MRRSVQALWGACFLVALMGCAGLRPSNASRPDPPSSSTSVAPALMRHFEGRASVTVESNPVTRVSGDFELDGDALSGELKVYGPVGGLWMVMRWSPDQATLIQGDQVQTSSSVDQLFSQLLGTSLLPWADVFNWLNGRMVQAEGWAFMPRTDSNGLFKAKRIQPQPGVEWVMAIRKSSP